MEFLEHEFWWFSFNCVMRDREMESKEGEEGGRGRERVCVAQTCSIKFIVY